jgi:hypothetical protein
MLRGTMDPGGDYDTISIILAGALISGQSFLNSGGFLEKIANSASILRGVNDLNFLTLPILLQSPSLVRVSEPLFLSSANCTIFH